MKIVYSLQIFIKKIDKYIYYIHIYIKNNMEIIYTLELEYNKYNVGKTKNLEKRIKQHFNNEGSEWTKTYKPIKLLHKIKGNGFDEEKQVLVLMEKYGIDNVRGGSYCQLKLSDSHKEKAIQIIQSITNKCYITNSRKILHI